MKQLFPSILVLATLAISSLPGALAADNDTHPLIIPISQVKQTMSIDIKNVNFVTITVPGKVTKVTCNTGVVLRNKETYKIYSDPDMPDVPQSDSDIGRTQTVMTFAPAPLSKQRPQATIVTTEQDGKTPAAKPYIFFFDGRTMF
jgi:hypothetical protein